MDESAPEVKQVPKQDKVTGKALFIKIVWYVLGLLESLLAIRFVLSLLGANPTNPFANFIYNLTEPFVRPFFSLFHYGINYNVSNFEGYTLVAMLIYLLVVVGFIKLVTITDPKN